MAELPLSAADPALLAGAAGTAAAIEERAASPGADTPERDLSEEPRRRPTKRKHSPSAPTPPSRSPAPPQDDSSSISNPPVLVPVSVPLPEHPSLEFYATRSHPFNKHGYRYTPCGPSPGTPLPVPPQRAIESYPPGIRWSWEDRSPFTFITEDAAAITTDKGWRAARSNIGVREGAWYWEFKIERGGGEGGREKGGEGQGSWVRVGVGRRESPLNAPVGIDGHSYGIRDKTGDSVHLAHPSPYGTPFSTHSTIGVYLSLPPRRPPSSSDRRDPARIVRKRVPIRYKGQLYFEQLEYPASKEMDELLVDPAMRAKQREADEKKKQKPAAPGTKAPPPEADQGPKLRPLPKLEGSKVAFFVDGVCQGVAFEDLYDFLPLRKPPGVKEKKKDVRLVMENHHDDGATGYFPFASVFGGGAVTINPGPDFEHPPPDDIEAALRASPHPPTRPPLAHALQHGGGGGPGWRPLCARYDEFVAEQARLDDLDEIEAIRLLQEAPPAVPPADPSAPAKKRRNSPAAATAAAAAALTTSKLANLGVVKAEMMAPSLSESPGASPTPHYGHVKDEMDAGA
ncbi:hypothetical protein JCM1841_001068 [Sporobolomyces salmonicolor]